MKNAKTAVIACLSAFCTILAAAQDKPHGLLTDLLEHTDKTWGGGIEISGAPQNGQNVQYAEIASAHPSFSWIVPRDGTPAMQTAYRIILSDNREDAENGKGNIWDSETVNSKESVSVIYAGEALKPNTEYFWRVKTITDAGGESGWSDIKAFRTADRLEEYKTAHYPIVKTRESPAEIKKIGAETFFIDFGKASFGQLVITLDSEKDGAHAAVHLGEKAKDGRLDRKPGGSIRYQRHELELKKGRHTYRIEIPKDKRNTGANAVLMPDYIGEVLPFRYCEIENYAGNLAAEDIARESAHYPFDNSAAQFKCSNETLNQVWDMCKYSIKATSFAGIYVDGDRERIPYEADALINQLCHYGVDREYSMARRSHEYLLERPTWPTEWILQSLIIAWNDYMHTGDSRSLKANYKILKARTLMALREKNGLISTKTGLQTPEFSASIRFNGKIKDIVDWPHKGILGLDKNEGGETDGFVFEDYNSVVNAFHYEALKIMGQTAKTLGLEKDAAFYLREAKSFRRRFNNAFFDKENGRYADGAATRHASLHANMFPLAFGMADRKNVKSVAAFIKSRGMACSVYGAQFLMDALYDAGEAEYALSMLTKTDDRGWYNMIRAGSTITFEAWDGKYKPNQDWNHAWGAVPANIIPRKLMGVEPLEPGFSLVRIRPQTASLEWAKAVLPTIRGQIRMKIENKKGIYSMRVSIPPNMEADVYLPLPEGGGRLSVNGNHAKTLPSDGGPFAYAGRLPPGEHRLEMTAK